MSIIKKHIVLIRFAILAAAVIMSAACNKSGKGNDSETGISKVAGRISQTADLFDAKNVSRPGINGRDMYIILAEVQPDGLLKTVSMQSVQANTDGKFVIETELNNTKNLILVASGNNEELKAIVTANVKRGGLVFAPPINLGSNKKADLYIKLISRGRTEGIAVADLDLLANRNGALYIEEKPDFEAKYIKTLSYYSSALFIALNNPYFGFAKQQIEAVQYAKEAAKVKLDSILYHNTGLNDEVENSFKIYEEYILAECIKNNISPPLYAMAMRTGVTSFVNSAAGLIPLDRIPLVRTIYKRYIYILRNAVGFQLNQLMADGRQIRDVESAANELNDSVKIAVNNSQIESAFDQYNRAVYKCLLNLIAGNEDLVDDVNDYVNEVGTAKEILRSSLITAVNPEEIIYAYIAFFRASDNILKTKFSGLSAESASRTGTLIKIINMN